MNEKNKKKKLVLTLSCIGIVLLLVGVTYSLTRFIFTGDREHTIDFKGLSFSYEEQANGLTLKNLKPMSDEDGLASGNDYTFKVSSTSSIARDVDFKVYLTLFDNNTLSKEYISLNLTNETTTTTTGVMLASDLESLEDDKYLVMNDKFSFDGVTKSLEYTYKLTIWINNNYITGGGYTVENNEQTTTIGGETFNFKINVAVGDNLTDVNPTVPSEPNAPVLASNMIPVTYDSSSSTWVKADSTNSNNSWYNYTNKIWANAVTVTSTNRDTYLKATPGTPIPMEDINTMWVWIPRFSATFQGKLCSTIKNPSVKFNFRCYNKGKINITEADKEQIINDFVFMQITSSEEIDELKTQMEAQFDELIANNDTETMDSMLQEYPMILMEKSISDYITISEEDKALILEMIGDETVAEFAFANGFGGYLVLMAADSGQTVTSDIYISPDDEMVPYLCNAIGVSSDECDAMLNEFNSIENSNDQVDMLFQILSVSISDPKINEIYYAQAADMVYDMTFNKNKKEEYDYNGGTEDSPGAFDITFVNKNTTAHDAFTFGSQNLSGFWIGKFENSSDKTCTASSYSAVGSGCNLNTIRPKILPNATSWRGAMVSTFFYDMLNMTENGNQYGFDKTKDTTLDTHMLKNNEWGAVAYLTQSIYGRCTSSTSCTEVGINNNSSYITGYGAPAGSDYVENDDEDPYVEPQPYNTEQGMDASTTGNIYGVYDMSGGTDENVMGVYTDGTKLWSGYSTSSNQHSGFNGWLYSDGANYEDGVEYPSDDKYYNVYTTESAYTNAGLQHALVETKNWYSDSTLFVGSSFPWFVRGGFYSGSSTTGVFGFDNYYGYSSTNFGSRSSIIIN